jgi:hypothetical protein
MAFGVEVASSIVPVSTLQGPKQAASGAQEDIMYVVCSLVTMSSLVL